MSRLFRLTNLHSKALVTGKTRSVDTPVATSLTPRQEFYVCGQLEQNEWGKPCRTIGNCWNDLR